MEAFGTCFACERLMPLEILKQVEYYQHHKIHNAYHHKLICVTCRKKARELGKSKLKT